MGDVIDLCSDTERTASKAEAKSQPTLFEGNERRDKKPSTKDEQEIAKRGQNDTKAENGTEADPLVLQLQFDLHGAQDEVSQYQVLLQAAQTRANAIERRLQRRVRQIRRDQDAAFNWLSHFPWGSVLKQELNEVFKIESFRPLQHQALNATLLKRDVFAILPTGAGKSLIYQLAAVVDRGLTVVVTPLISLSQDQQSALQDLNIHAVAIDSTTPPDVLKSIYREILPPGGQITGSREPRKKRRKKGKKGQKGQKGQRQQAKGGAQENARGKASSPWSRDDMDTVILFVTPEQVVRSKKLMGRLEGMHEAGHLSRICIDEAHCCSSWGHDFRADYRKLGILRRQCATTPILALSATCSPSTMEDVCEVLETRNAVTFRGSINRPNLFYEVRTKRDNDDDVLSDITHWLRTEFKDKSGIIYVLSRRECESYAEKFRQGGILAGSYHGDMDRSQRFATHTEWSEGRLRIVVATIAFGLGIDNHHTRFVIHATMATSLEGYYQESGRCGRDGRSGVCIVLQRAKDFSRLSAFVADKGDARVQKFYQMYRYAIGGVRVNGVPACRRAMIAAAFGEGAPQVANGDPCCDLCRRRQRGEKGSVRVDVTRLAGDIVQVVSQRGYEKPNEKITMLAAAMNWSNKGPKGCEFRGGVEAIDRRIDVNTRLEILVQLVFQKVFQEYFRHSSYSITAYVQCADGGLADDAVVTVDVGEDAAVRLVAYGGCSRVGEGEVGDVAKEQVVVEEEVLEEEVVEEEVLEEEVVEEEVLDEGVLDEGVLDEGVSGSKVEQAEMKMKMKMEMEVVPKDEPKAKAKQEEELVRRRKLKRKVVEPEEEEEDEGILEEGILDEGILEDGILDEGILEEEILDEGQASF